MVFTYDPADLRAFRLGAICSLFQALCSDDTPMVRRAAASNIGVCLSSEFVAQQYRTNWLVFGPKKFAPTLEKEHISALVIPLFRALTSDDQDSVRLLAIESSSAIADLLSPEENSQFVLPIVRASVEDRSWRVRFSIAKDFFPLSRAMGKQITESELLACFTNLLQVCMIIHKHSGPCRVV